jgi:LemA protein
MNAKGWLAVILIIITILSVSVMVMNNHLVGLDVACDNQWANVEAQYQRRYDLIPNIIDATKLYINYEGSLLMNITEARSRWASALTQQDELEANAMLDSVTNRLLAILTVENYPELKADQVVLGLIDELEGTENRISVQRMYYNNAVAEYNGAIRMIPMSAVASMFRFDERDYFSADWDARDAPTVN